MAKTMISVDIPRGHGRGDWVRSLRDQCLASCVAGVPFFFKQWGGPTPKSGGRILDGRAWDEFPAVHALAGAAS